MAYKFCQILGSGSFSLNFFPGGYYFTHPLDCSFKGCIEFTRFVSYQKIDIEMKRKRQIALLSRIGCHGVSFKTSIGRNLSDHGQ